MAEQHSHAHHDHAHTGHGHDYAKANQEYFDENLAMFERPDIVDATRRVAAAMRERYPSLFNAESTTVLDYACGSGLFSREMSAHVKSIVGIDISTKAVDEYNAQAAKHGLSDKLRAIAVELKADGQLEGTTQHFEVVLCTMAYHHFARPEEVTKILASFLKPGGSLLVVDFISNEKKEEIVSEEHKKTVPHAAGFDEDQMKAMFTAAGLANFEMEVLLRDVPIHVYKITSFLARGVKPQ